MLLTIKLLSYIKMIEFKKKSLTSKQTAREALENLTDAIPGFSGDPGFSEAFLNEFGATERAFSWRFNTGENNGNHFSHEARTIRKQISKLRGEIGQLKVEIKSTKQQHAMRNIRRTKRCYLCDGLNHLASSCGNSTRRNGDSPGSTGMDGGNLSPSRPKMKGPRSSSASLL